MRTSFFSHKQRFPLGAFNTTRVAQHTLHTINHLHHNNSDNKDAWTLMQIMMLCLPKRHDQIVCDVVSCLKRYNKHQQRSQRLSCSRRTRCVEKKPSLNAKHHFLLPTNKQDTGWHDPCNHTDRTVSLKFEILFGAKSKT
jgi:hypothetical protein